MPVTDRDLLMLEPNLFRDLGWLGQRRFGGTGSIAGTTLTVSGDVALDDAGVSAGHVALVDETAYEVLERLSATELTVSRLRAEATGATIPPTPVSGKPVAVYTFEPQVALARAQVLRSVGIDPEGESAGAPTEGDILNPGALRSAIALGALHLVFTAAADFGDPEALAGKATMYGDRFAAELRRVTVEIDTDGDGQPNALRRAAAAFLHRA